MYALYFFQNPSGNAGLNAGPSAERPGRASGIIFFVEDVDILPKKSCAYSQIRCDVYF